MKMQTRVRFADGTEVVEDCPDATDAWPDGTLKLAHLLTEAIERAEAARGGEPHDGAYLEPRGVRM